MATPKIPQDVIDELAEMNLTIWICKYATIYDRYGAGRGKADLEKVEVQITGPGLTQYAPWGHGPTVRAAVDSAMRDPKVIDRIKGLKGAIFRFDKALSDLGHTVLLRRLAMHNNFDDSDDDTIPF